MIADGKRDLVVTLKSLKKLLVREAVKINPAKLEVGPGQKRQLKKRLKKLNSKKTKMSS